MVACRFDRPLLAGLIAGCVLSFSVIGPASADEPSAKPTPTAESPRGETPLVDVSAPQRPTAEVLSHPRVNDKLPYQPEGATATPHVEVRWNRYHDYTAATRLLQALAKAFPDRTRLVSLGPSYGNRQMWVLAITNFKTGSDMDRPAMWIDGGIHANEIQASEVVLYTAWYLLEMYDSVPRVRDLVDNRTFYLMPMMSPDSRDAHLYEANTTHSPRSGQRPIGDARDGAVRDEPRDDLDNDGSLTQMRIRDPNGRFKPDPNFPERLVRAAPDERGSYTLLGEEEFDRSGAGKIYRVRNSYYDPNRDWPWHWEPNYVQPGAYRYPLSIPENRLVADFITDHRNIATGQSYHNAGGMILRGPGVKGDRYEPGDVARFDVMGKRGERILPGYRYMNVADDLYECYGCELDWLYMMRGVMAFTNELLPPSDFYHQKVEGGYFAAEAQLHEFNRDLLLGGGFVPWHEVNHPLYGKIEVGGFKKNWVRQPPSFMLEEECHRNMAFSLYQADQMPLVKVQSIGEKALEGPLTEVTAVIANERMLPTRTDIDIAHDLTPPDLVTLEAPKLQVITGLVSRDPFFQNATEQQDHPAALRVKAIPGMGAMYVRWIVEGAGPYEVRVRSFKGGSAKRSSTAN